MLTLDFHPVGRHFLQIPGPSPVPDRILRAIGLPTIDHRGPEFAVLGLKCLTGIRAIFKTPWAFYAPALRRWAARIGLRTAIAMIATTTLAMAPIHKTLCQSPAPAIRAEVGTAMAAAVPLAV